MQDKGNNREQGGKLLGGKYRLQEVIGAGGQAVVYRALDEKLGKEWAVKEIPLPAAQAAAGRERLLAECYVLKNMDCPYIPRIVDFYEEPEQVYLVMDLVKGPTLEEMVRQRGGLQEKEALEVGVRLAEALEALHQASPPVLYLDLKPANVIVTGKRGLKLVDFGSAVIAGKERESFLTGTRGYAAPEQRAGTASVRSDIYSLGRTLAFLVTGQEPSFAPQEAICCRAGLSGGLAAVLERCTKAKPEERYGSAAQVRIALQNCLDSRKGKGLRKGKTRCRKPDRKRWNGRQMFQQEKNVLRTEKTQWIFGFLAGLACMGLLAATGKWGAEPVLAAGRQQGKPGILLRDEKGRRLLIREERVLHTDAPLYLELQPGPFAGKGELAVHISCGGEEFSFIYCSTALP